ncbi:MAG TPA: sulfatase [Bryobacteraceae bacterium]|nr:sulfatase [Bryobacteraceae bacterium]
MRTAALLLVFVTAKAIMLAGHHVSVSWWSPLAYFWQDAAAVLVFAALEWLARSHSRLAWTTYATAALYAAINIPVARVLSTPLTWPMLHAARGPLADSIRYYVTLPNALAFAAAVVVAVMAPRCLRRLPRASILSALTLSVAFGPLAASRVDTQGMERNAWTALVPLRAPGAAPPSTAGNDWRTGLEQTPQIDLSAFRAAAGGRNIVLVSLESTGAQYLGLYGAAPDPMPNLSDLARSAIVFDNAYAAYPESIKGLFSILCAQYPAFASDAERYASVPCHSIAAALGAAGYRTAMFHSGRFVYLGMNAVIRDRGFDTLEDAGDIGGNHQSSFGVDEPSTVARILKWIDRLPVGQPFFVAYLPIAGHHPYETPGGGPFPGADDFGRYRNALHYGDASLGDLRAGLRERGLDQKTLWIVLGDHGEAFGQHDGNSGHTFQIYEENVHVPFLVAAPGLIRDQIRSAQVVSLIDTAPTVLDLAGLPIPKEYQGRSMLERGPRMAFFFADYSLGLLGLRDGPRKFILESNSGRPQLYDLNRDPHERTNLAPAFQPQSRWYEQALRVWIASHTL